MIRYLGTFIDRLLFHSKMVMIILQEIRLISIMPLKEVKRINALVDTKPFFDQPLKSKQETYVKNCRNVKK